MPKTNPIPVRLPEEQAGMLKELASRTPLKESQVLRIAVWEILKRFKDDPHALRQAHFEYVAKYPENQTAAEAKERASEKFVVSVTSQALSPNKRKRKPRRP